MAKIINLIGNISVTNHIIISFGIRVVMIACGSWLDEYSEVPFTDIDYRVVTDGARHILANRSPYTRHTYRYSPLLAMALTPNILIHECWGKLLFSVFDLAVGVLIYLIVFNGYQTIWLQNALVWARQMCEKFRWKRFDEEPKLPRKYHEYAKWAAISWLYNPLVIAISTRGNGDSITSALVLLTLYTLLKPKKDSTDFFVAGLIHGLAIHFRLYPIAFSLAYYLYVAHDHRGNIFRSIFGPNRNQLFLVAGTIASLAFLTYTFYLKYGYEFLYETYLYHLIRKDTRHNFSLYFYMQYLSSGEQITLLEKILTFSPQFLILILTAIHFGRHFQTIPFCLFVQSFTMVIFNPVITSQYFVWFISLLPLCWTNLTRIGIRKAIAYCVLWFVVQAAWLGTAYLLEFRGWNMFSLIWIDGILFFCMNMLLLQKMIINFNVISDLRIKQS